MSVRLMHFLYFQTSLKRRNYQKYKNLYVNKKVNLNMLRSFDDLLHSFRHRRQLILIHQ